MTLDRKLWVKKMPIGWIFCAQTAFAWTTVEFVLCSLDSLMKEKTVTASTFY